MPLSYQAKRELAVHDFGSVRKNCLQSDQQAIVHVATSVDEAMSASGLGLLLEPPQLFKVV